MNERTEQARTLHPTIHLVPHTHWDREWYEPFQVFRMRLVELVDHVLELLDAEPEFRFTLDGQLATIDDYLEVRPEAEPRIRRFVAEGRLAVGPWQILMDEFHVSGETIVRNLQRGWARARELGGAMEIGYLPDMFGHIAQMPQILRRAGMSDAVVWRGVPAAVERNHFAWRSPDGSEVRSEYLVGGYGNGVFLFAVPGRAADKARAHHALMRPFYGDETLLAMYGSDHMSPLRETVSLVDGVNASQSEVRVRIDTLADYIRASRDTERDEPLVIEGELRSSARANILMGVTSAHTDIKAAAARAERWLTRYAEPFQALYGGIWPARLFDLAWQRVIENSAHDSICGCSVDPVAAQVLVRYAEAEQIARGLTARALAPLASRVARGSWICANPSPHHRAGLVELAVAAPDSWPAVALELTDGRRIAAQEIRRNRPVVYEAEFTRADLLRFLQTHLGGRHTLGKIVNGGRVERQEQGNLLTLDLDDDPDPEWVDIDELRTELELAVASLGDGRWTLRAVAAPRRTVRAMVDAPALGFAALRPVNGPGSIDDRVVASSDTLRNGLLQVSVAGDGTLSLMRGGITIEGVGRLVDGGDAGDSYNYAPPRDDVTIDQPESVTTVLVAGGPVVGELVVTRTYNWPLALAEDASTRAAVTTTVAVAMHVELRAGEPFARIRLEFDNRASDHRLRFHVPLPRAADRSAAEGQFAVVERGLTNEAGNGEVSLPTFPAYGFVDAGGVAVLYDQITEYELLDGRELALTCLRSIGLISRNNHAYREAPAGPELTAPAAQLHGCRAISFGLYPHDGGWHEADVQLVAERYAHDFVLAGGTAAASAERLVTADGNGSLAISGSGVVMSALHRRGEWLELRVVAQQPAAVTAVVEGGIVEAREADLLGRAGPALGVESGRLSLALRPWEIRTVQLRR